MGKEIFFMSGMKDKIVILIKGNVLHKRYQGQNRDSD
ncbi:hypothetical protein ABID53_001488 [Bacillus oleivorans]